MRGMSPRALGLTLGLLASLLWGTVFAAGRYLVDVRGIDPMFVAALRFNLGWIAAISYLMLSGRSRDLKRAAAEWPRIAGLGALGIFCMGSGVFLAVQFTSSINAGIIVNANPVFIALFAPLIGERVPLLRTAGLLVGLAGCVLVSLGDLAGTPGGSNDLLGCAFATLSACSWAAYTVVGKGISQRLGGLETGALALFFGGLLYLPVVALKGAWQPLNGSELAVAVFLGVGPSAFSMLIWYKALEYVDANVLGPTQYFATLVGTFLGWSLLGEKIGLAFMLGGAAIILGLWLATRPARSEVT